MAEDITLTDKAEMIRIVHWYWHHRCTRWVATGTMTPEEADRHVAILQAMVEDYTHQPREGADA